MSDKICVRFTLSIGIHNAKQETEVEYDRAEWESMSDKDKEQDWQDWANNYIDGGWSEAE